MSKDAIVFTLIGYFSGSILYAPLFGKLLKGRDILEESRDQNPGTANAFMYGGFLCGILTLCCDLVKGFFPVYLYLRIGNRPIGAELAMVLAAPVVGHIFPVFFGFRGGKGIATSFGSLLGLLPETVPVLLLAGTFLFFTFVLRVRPHYYRTALTYLITMVLMILLCRVKGIVYGFSIITLSVLIRLGISREEKGAFEVQYLWRH